MTDKTFSKGEIIFKEGDIEWCMYLVKSGLVRVAAGYGTDNEITLTEIGPGGQFGEMGMLDYRPRSATVIALEDTVVTVIRDDELNDYIHADPVRLLRILAPVSKRIDELSVDYQAVCADIRSYYEAENPSSPLKKRIAELVAFAKKYTGMHVG